jgi:hypothetical protein
MTSSSSAAVMNYLNASLPAITVTLSVVWRIAVVVTCPPYTLQVAISNFQKHGSITRVAPPPPRAGMQRAEAALRKRRISIEWLSAYLLPHELEVVARASIYPGSFSAYAAVAVGCRASPSEQQQQQQPCTGLATGNHRDQEEMCVSAGVEQVLRGLVLMSVLFEGEAGSVGEQRFSMHPLIRELGRELRCGQLREVCGGNGGAVEVMMVQWIVGDDRGPGRRLVLHNPTGSRPNSRVCQEVMAEEAANFREAARLLGSRGGIGEGPANEKLVGDMLHVGGAM